MGAHGHTQTVPGYEIETIAEGTCCSAATFMLLGGKKRMIGKHAHILIHQLSAGFMGKYKDLRDELKTCKKIMKMMKVCTRVKRRFLNQSLRK